MKAQAKDQVEVLRAALDDLTMPLGKGGWESCVADILGVAPALLERLDRQAAQIAELHKLMPLVECQADLAAARAVIAWVLKLASDRGLSKADRLASIRERTRLALEGAR